MGFGAHRIRLTSNGLEVGSWSADECTIVANEAGSYLIVAENEELPFSPSSSESFASALAAEQSQPLTKTAVPPPRHLEEGAPRPLTMIGFYLLATLTALLGIWAIWSIVV